MVSCGKFDSNPHLGSALDLWGGLQLWGGSTATSLVLSLPLAVPIDVFCKPVGETGGNGAVLDLRGPTQSPSPSNQLMVTPDIGTPLRAWWMARMRLYNTATGLSVHELHVLPYAS